MTSVLARNVQPEQKFDPFSVNLNYNEYCKKARNLTCKTTTVPSEYVNVKKNYPEIHTIYSVKPENPQHSVVFTRYSYDKEKETQSFIADTHPEKSRGGLVFDPPLNFVDITVYYDIHFVTLDENLERVYNSPVVIEYGTFPDLSVDYSVYDKWSSDMNEQVCSVSITWNNLNFRVLENGMVMNPTLASVSDIKIWRQFDVKEERV